MSKRIIIKDADFSDNALDMQLYVEQTLLTMTASGAGNRNNTASSVRNKQRLSAWANSSCQPILIKAGMSVTLSGLKGKVAGAKVLRVDYCYYSKDNAVPVDTSTANPNLVGTASNFVSSNFFPINADGENDAVTITNNYGHDYYFAFSFRGIGDSDVIEPASYDLWLKW